MNSCITQVIVLVNVQFLVFKLIGILSSSYSSHATHLTAVHHIAIYCIAFDSFMDFNLKQFCKQERTAVQNVL